MSDLHCLGILFNFHLIFWCPEVLTNCTN